MMQAMWWVVGASVRGASHKRQGIPNQDALLLQTYRTANDSKTQSVAFAAVADGHGSARYFRSERGAKFAVKAAAFAVSEMLVRYPGWQLSSDDLQLAKSWFYQHMPQLILHKWVEYVRADISLQPYGPEEKSLMSGRVDSGPHPKPNRPLATRSQVLDSDLEPYGTTLGLALVTDSYVAYASLGDVDVVTVTGDGESVRALALSEEVGEATHSLCLPNATSHFQMELHAIDESGRPAMIFVGTDGFSKSYSTEAKFLETCKAYSDALGEHDAYTLESELSTWLTQTTTSGSGDDVTVGMIFDASIRAADTTGKRAPNSFKDQSLDTQGLETSTDSDQIKAPNQDVDTDRIQDLLLSDLGSPASDVEGHIKSSEFEDPLSEHRLMDIRIDESD